jgi:hypothetical protein
MENGHEIWYVECTKSVLGSSIMRITKEISKCQLDLVGVQKVRWDKGGTKLAGEYIFFDWKRNQIHGLGTGYVQT